MKQSETTMLHSGNPLSPEETREKVNSELIAVKLGEQKIVSTQQNPSANDPKFWDVDWFNSYE